MGVDGVGAASQSPQPGHSQGVTEAGAGTDLERLGAGRSNIQPVEDRGGCLDDDVMSVGGQYPGAVGQVGADPSGGRSADLEDPQAPGVRDQRGTDLIQAADGAGAHAFSFFAGFPMSVGAAWALRAALRRLRSARWIAIRTMTAATAAPSTAVRTARVGEAT